MDTSLNRIPVVIDEEDDNIDPIADHIADRLRTHLKSAISSKRIVHPDAGHVPSVIYSACAMTAPAHAPSM